MHRVWKTNTNTNTNTGPNPGTNANTGGTAGSRSVGGLLRTRWAAIGAAVAVSVGGGGIGLVHATIDSGDKPVLVNIEPCRLADTRPDSQVGPRNTPLGADETYDLDGHGVVGNCTIPNGAVALSMNVTAVNASQNTNLRFFPAGAAVPTAANLNPAPNQPPAPNAVTTGLNGAGQFSAFNKFGTVDVIIDVNGYYEDHNHDDRYVQLDQMLWAVVDVDGTLVRSSDGVTLAALNPGVPTGDYVVVFEPDISNCAYQATVGRPGVNVGPTPGFAQVANWADNPEHGVIVFTKDQNGAGVENRGFHLLVTC